MNVIYRFHTCDAWFGPVSSQLRSKGFDLFAVYAKAPVFCQEQGYKVRSAQKLLIKSCNNQPNLCQIEIIPQDIGNIACHIPCHDVVDHAFVGKQMRSLQ